MMTDDFRVERDSLGEVSVPKQSLWGAQTQRSLQNFAIADDVFTPTFIKSLVLIKKSAALVNKRLKRLDSRICKAIVAAADEILNGQHQDQFPLKVWQTGSGTQTNMNVNEVIANRANQILGIPLDGEKQVHPNDHVNLSQSSNDTFPTAMHLAIITDLRGDLLPALDQLMNVLDAKAKGFEHVIKTGRTHLMDATPLTVSQELSSYKAQLEFCGVDIKSVFEGLSEIAQGGTAVGTGLNAPKDFACLIAKELSQQTGLTLQSAKNKFMALAAHDPVLKTSSSLRHLATVLFKFANDLRWLASGPRCGIGEYLLPANEPGSSIMPGKVNPTQCEAVTMLCAQVMGLDQAVAMAASQGQLQLNTFKPLMIHNVQTSICLLADGMNSFRKNCLEGLTVNQDRIDQHLKNSLMLVTALTPKIGYDKAAEIAKHALASHISLRDAAKDLGILNYEQYDEAIDIKAMVHPH